MKSLESNERISRREALKWIGKRTAETGYLVGVNTVGLGITIRSQKDEARQAEINAQEGRKRVREADLAGATENRDALRTKYFARDIIKAGFLATDGKDDNSIIETIAGAFGGNAIIAYLLRNHSEMTNRVVGAATGVSARSLDIVSTLAFAKYFSDPRFEEYGFGPYFGEGNPLFGTHPSIEKTLVVGGTTTALIGGVGFVAPFVGRSYAGAVGFVAKHNYYGAHAIKTSLEIGDQVKRLIGEGRNELFITDYLYQLQPEVNSQEPSVDQV